MWPSQTRGSRSSSLLALANEPANFVAENLVVEPKAVGPGRVGPDHR